MKESQHKEYVSNAFMGRIPAACDRYSFGEWQMRRLAKEAGAAIRVGRILFVNYEIMDKYLLGKLEGKNEQSDLNCKASQ